MLPTSLIDHPYGFRLQLHCSIHQILYNKVWPTISSHKTYLGKSSKVPHISFCKTNGHQRTIIP
uniref:Uncharacterized protein n=1 Tax=Rhizophora mucronata TaxID=61149 RepID=A0A2P2N7H0_RHIMU